MKLADKELCVQSRPFGVALLIAGFDDTGPVLYHADPSGTYVSYEARAIGSGSEGAQSLLQEKYTADMSLADAEVLVMQVLKQVRKARSLIATLCCKLQHQTSGEVFTVAAALDLSLTVPLTVSPLQ
jgi:20S proteasome alpha/beta subunit